MDDLISFESEPQSTTTTAIPTPTLPSSPPNKATETQLRQVCSDSFASLNDLMRSKKQWSVVSKPVSTPVLKPSITVPTGRSQLPAGPSSNSPMWGAENFREDPFAVPTSSKPVDVFPLHAKVADVLNESLQILPSSHQNYGQVAMEQMELESFEDTIAELCNMNTEGPSDWEKASTEYQKVESPLQTTLGRDHGAEAAHKEAAHKEAAHKEAAHKEAAHQEAAHQEAAHKGISCMLADSESAARLTQSAWDDMIAQIASLKQEKTQALSKLAILEYNEHLGRQTKGDNSTELDQLRYRLEKNKDYKATMSRDIRQKDAELLRKDLEIEDLKMQLVKTEAMPKDLEKLHAKLEYMRTETQQKAADVGVSSQIMKMKDQEIIRLKEIIAQIEYMRTETQQKAADAGVSSQIMKMKDQEIIRLKEIIAQIEHRLSGHQMRADNLAGTQAIREKRMRQAEEQLHVAQDTKEKLLDDVDLLKTEIAPMKHRIKVLEEQVREKTSSCDRMRSDLAHTEKRLRTALAALHKIDNHNELKGAAHLIAPSPMTQLPEFVLPCIDCITKNFSCDSNSRCQNCVNSDEKCRRLRCSQMHILLDGCQDYPCMLLHDANGWLEQATEQPQW